MTKQQTIEVKKDAGIMQSHRSEDQFVTPYVATTPEAVQAPSNAIDPIALIDHALKAGASPDTFERLFALQERLERNQARRSYNEAIAIARSEIGPIAKNRTVDFTSAKGRTNYKFEDLAEIARTVDPVLSKHGLSYRYRTEQGNGVVRVTCIVSHCAGYCEETTLEGPNDVSGNKNSIQAVGSTLTFLQRYTLKAALGLAVSNDDDGQASGRTASAAELTARQARQIRDLIAETKSDEALFLKTARAASIENIDPRHFERLTALLQKKKRNAAAAKDITGKGDVK